MSFSGDGKWRQNVLGHGYSYLAAPASAGRTAGRRRWCPGADGNDRMIVVVRRPTGADTSFSGDGLAVIRFSGIANSDAYDLAIQPNGEIVVAGEG